MRILSVTSSGERGRMRAEEFFEQARDAARDMERITRTIEDMKSREEVGGASMDSMPRGGFGNPMNKVDSRMDFERLNAATLEEAERTVNDACNLLFGRDGRSGLARAFGNQYAEVLWLRYLDKQTISGLSKLYDCATNTVYRRIRTALDFIDSNGFEATMSGRNDIN